MDCNSGIASVDPVWRAWRRPSRGGGSLLSAAESGSNTEGTKADTERTEKRRSSPLFPLWPSVSSVVKIRVPESVDSNLDLGAIQIQ